MDYYKRKDRQDLTTDKVKKFLENGILDNVLFNFFFARGMGLKNGLIDVDRAFQLIQKMNQNQLDNSEPVPEKPLDEEEKWQVV